MGDRKLYTLVSMMFLAAHLIVAGNAWILLGLAFLWFSGSLFAKD